MGVAPPEHVPEQTPAGPAAPGGKPVPISTPGTPAAPVSVEWDFGQLPISPPVPAAAGPTTRAPLRAGDQLQISVYGIPGEAQPEARYSGRYLIDAAGAITFNDGTNTVPVRVAGTEPAAAARIIADALVAAQLFRGPQVALTGPGMAAPVTANAATAMSPEVARADGNFRAYLATTAEPPDAVARYYTWLNEHRDSPEFLTTSPPDLWSLCLKAPVRQVDPVQARREEWIRFMQDRQTAIGKLAEPERGRELRTLLKFQDYYDAHKDRPGFLGIDLAVVYADLATAELKTDIDTGVRRKLEQDKAAAQSSPEVLAARGAKFDEFLAKAMRLWGHSSRSYPYVIPIDVQGKDILVTGQPAVQQVLDRLAGELMSWASRHLNDSNFASVSVNAVLVDLLDGGFSADLAEAQATPLEHETHDRNEILLGPALASFGEAVATGLLVVAVVGLFVGAEVITAGQATWILVGIGGVGGIGSYLGRREEIEQTTYDVPVSSTMLASAGDVVGVSQLVEGMTGERLGTGQPMGSEARSESLGAGAGNVATLLVGSRAYRKGQAIGQEARLSMPGKVPAGPNANQPIRGRKPYPEPAKVNPNPEPVEAAARKALSPELQPGFDLWVAEMRANGANPEEVLAKLSADKIKQQANTFLSRQTAAEALAKRTEYEAARAADDPLHPHLLNVEAIPGEKVTLHYNKKPPTKREIAQAIRIARRTGEEIHLFGDTASGINYPGIDGTIGRPPRALSLKDAVGEARPNLAAKMAGDAQEAATAHGYSHVEVYIDLPGRTLAEIRAAWNAPPPLRTDPLPAATFNGNVIAKVVVTAADGTMVLTPPLKGPAQTGVVPALVGPQEEERPAPK